jgi:Tol biopolymer transport system component
MSQDDGLDRRLTAWLDVEAAPIAPIDLRMRFADGVGRTRQRPAWATTERWISMETRARLGGVPRLVIILATMGLLAALAAAGAIVIGSDGPVRNGRIAFMSNTDIYTVEPDGSDRRLLVDVESTLTGVAWSPDGTRLAYWSEAPELSVIDADGSDPTVVASGDAARGIPIQGPSWSPDGSKLAFTGVTVGGPQTACVGSSDSFPYKCTMRVFVAEVGADASTGLIQVGDPDTNALAVAWSPDGRTIAFTSGDAQKEGIGLYLMDADGTDVRRIDKVSGPGWSISNLAWSPDGRTIAATAGMGTRDIWEFAVDGTTQRMVLDTFEVAADQPDPASAPDGAPAASPGPSSGPGFPGNPAYAPDGAMAWSGWLLEPGGSPRTMAVRTPPWSAPVWSPDGRFIAGPDGSGDVVVIDRDGTIVARIEGASSEVRVSWQPLPG